MLTRWRWPLASFAAVLVVGGAVLAVIALAAGDEPAPPDESATLTAARQLAASLDRDLAASERRVASLEAELAQSGDDRRATEDLSREFVELSIEVAELKAEVERLQYRAERPVTLLNGLDITAEEAAQSIWGLEGQLLDLFTENAALREEAKGCLDVLLEPGILSTEAGIERVLSKCGPGALRLLIGGL